MFSGLIFSSTQENSWNSRIGGKEMSELKAMEGEGKTGREIGTAIQDLRDRNLVTEERLLGQLFRGYFNNKMTLLVFLIQTKKLRLNEKSSQLACGFLDDMYRHMLPEGLQRKYRLVFLWLKKFFLKLPDVTAKQRNKAIGFIRSLYGIFGVNLNTGGQT